MPEWYRNTDWNEAVEAEFFERLARARSQRDQYIVIQALTLADSHPKVALRLVDLYFATGTNDFHAPRARMAASRARFADGGYEKALDDYEASLEAQEDGGRAVVASPLEYAFTAARYRSVRHYSVALAYLAEVSPPKPGLAEAVFRFHAARALLLHETGRDPATARRDAATALDLPDALIALFSDMVWRLRGIVRR